MESKSRKRKRGKKLAKSKKLMALEIKQVLKESDKGSYYNQEGFFVDFDDNAESCETDSSSDSPSKSVSYLKLN